MRIRQFAMRAVGVVAVAAAACLGTTATVTAAPAPAPALWTLGAQMLTLGQNAFCNGIIDFSVETDPAKPGRATTLIMSRGMHGLGPEWANNPTCPVEVDLIWIDGVFPFYHTISVPVQLGEKPQTERVDINPGSGLIILDASAGYVNPTYTKLRPQYSTAVGAYVIIP
jgi:hypothetical protein